MGSVRLRGAAAAAGVLLYAMAAAATAPAQAYEDPAGPSYAESAEPAGTVLLTPAKAAPGGEVGLRVEGCDGGTGTATSTVFVADAELAPAEDGDGLRAETTVRSGAEPGDYAVSVKCGADGTRAEGTLTVGGSHASPTAPVRAGGGAAAEQQRRERIAAAQDGPNTRQVVVGAALAGGAVLAMTGIAARRRPATGPTPPGHRRSDSGPPGSGPSGSAASGSGRSGYRPSGSARSGSGRSGPGGAASGPPGAGPSDRRRSGAAPPGSGPPGSGAPRDGRPSGGGDGCARG